MKINLTLLNNITKKIIIQVTNPNDPLILYSLELSDIEYHQLKSEQSLLIDFQNFPAFLLQMLDLCINDKEQTYQCILQKMNNIDALLIICQRTQFREINQLVLKVQQANDIALKKFLGGLSYEFKQKYEDTLNQLNELKNNYDNIYKENDDLKAELKQEKLNQENKINNIINEKTKEMNNLKEENIKETKEKMNKLEKDKNTEITELNKKYAELQKQYEKSNNKLKELEEYKLKLEMTHKDLEGKHAISNTELNVYKEDISNLRQDNSSLNQKCFKQEKDITELQCKNESLTKQLEEKNKNIENLQQLVDTLGKQRESGDDTLKSLKATNAKLEDKLQTSINEINKGNEIIKKLQNEIKAQKSKLKANKQTLNSQEQLVNQKQLIIDENIRNINDLKRDIDNKEREITNLKNQIQNYALKLTENEKLLEDNKNMITYLNKNLNENNNNPFKSRFNNPNDNMLYGQGLSSSMDKNYEFTNNIGNMNNMSNTGMINKNMNGFSTMNNLNSNIQNNLGQTGTIGNYTYSNSNTNFNQIASNSNNNFNQSHSSQNNYMINKNNNEQLADSELGGQSQMRGSKTLTVSGNTSGMLIMPETNFCNYKGSARFKGSQVDKYLNNTGSTGGGNTLLQHKYGVTNSLGSSGFNNDNPISSSQGYGDNYEEEMPRQATEPVEMLKK